MCFFVTYYISFFILGLDLGQQQKNSFLHVPPSSRMTSLKNSDDKTGDFQKSQEQYDSSETQNTSFDDSLKKNFEQEYPPLIQSQKIMTKDCYAVTPSQEISSKDDNEQRANRESLSVFHQKAEKNDVNTLEKSTKDLSRAASLKNGAKTSTEPLESGTLSKQNGQEEDLGSKNPLNESGTSPKESGTSTKESGTSPTKNGSSSLKIGTDVSQKPFQKSVNSLDKSHSSLSKIGAKNGNLSADNGTSSHKSGTSFLNNGNKSNLNENDNSILSNIPLQSQKHNVPLKDSLQKSPKMSPNFKNMSKEGRQEAKKILETKSNKLENANKRTSSVNLTRFSQNLILATGSSTLRSNRLQELNVKLVILAATAEDLENGVSPPTLEGVASQNILLNENRDNEQDIEKYFHQAAELIQGVKKGAVMVHAPEGGGVSALKRGGASSSVDSRRGEGFAAALCAAFLIKHEGQTAKEALENIK